MPAPGANGRETRGVLRSPKRLVRATNERGFDVSGQRQPRGVQDHRHQRVVAVQRNQLQGTVQTKAFLYGGKRGFARASRRMDVAAERVDRPLFLREIRRL